MTNELLKAERIKIMQKSEGFIAALDQSGGSTPKALSSYGISEKEYKSQKEMFDLIHQMRVRVITSKSFTNEHIIGAILFEKTMESKIKRSYTADYLWKKKKIIPFLKIDVGLDERNEDCELMKPIENLSRKLSKAIRYNIFGTKMRSVIYGANEHGIKEIVKQQFDLARIILNFGLVPIIEPEVSIDIKDKEAAESILKSEIFKHLNSLGHLDKVIFKLTIPTVDNFYRDLEEDPHTLRVVALSGGYSLDLATEKLSKNNGMIASFSRALLDGLNASQTEEEFDEILKDHIYKVYNASIK